MARTIAKDHDAKRQAILKTAARFFAVNGYDRSSMSQLAVECGISKALIYHYYSGKEALLFDILNSHLGALVDDALGVDMTNGNARKNLLDLVQSILRSYKDADNEHRLQLEAMASLSDQQRGELADLQKTLVGHVSEAIRAVDPSLFDRHPHHLRPVTMSLFGMLNWFYMWYRKGKGVTREDYGKLVTDMTLGGLKEISSNGTV